MKLENMSVTQLQNLLTEREAEQNTQNQKKELLDKLAKLEGKDGWSNQKPEEKTEVTSGFKVKPHRSL
ncbi:MAG: hypothetical protein ACYTX0_36965, partial [Nostoc sp.]